MHPPSAILRPARPEDRPFLIELTVRLADFPIPPWRTGEEIARADDPLIDAALCGTDPDILLLVAQDSDGLPLGAVLATTREDYFTHAKHAHIEILAVVPEAAGKGVARLLMDAAERWAHTHGFPHVTLNVFATNQRAREIYEHLGYVPETLRYFKKLG